MKIKDIDFILRPREKLIKFGLKELSFQELLAIIIKTGTKKENVIDVSQKILTKYPETEFENLNLKKLKEFKGIGEVKACEILAMIEIHRRLNKIKSHKDITKIKNSDDAYNIFIKEIDDINQERLILMCLNTASNIISLKTIFKGSLNECIIHPREIFNHAIQNNSCSIIIAHNHPSNQNEPSEEDKRITNIIYEAGKMLGIPLLDHLILTKDSYYSFKDNDLI
ncbi:MAG: DNA repair protein RadC [Candidatus Nanoarchaeia archaeon]|nr:DNA repair protein RadC [Candidatus Nanoarchaeia archaeon]